MRNEFPDKLFRQKLAGHQVQPSVDAWQKLEAKLAHKEGKKYVVWWRMAAALLLLATLSTIYINWSNSDLPLSTDQALVVAQQMPLQSEVSDAKPIELPADVEKSVQAETSKPEVNRASLNSNTSLASNKISPAPVQKSADPVIVELKESTQTLVAKAEAEIVNAVTELELIQDTKTVIAQSQITENAEAEFTIEVFRGLDDTDMIDAEKSEKGKGWKGIVNFAIDFKNGELGLDDIRDKKDELLAGEFSERRRNQRNRK
jgi:hypothetical protein